MSKLKLTGKCKHSRVIEHKKLRQILTLWNQVFNITQLMSVKSSAKLNTEFYKKNVVNYQIGSKLPCIYIWLFFFILDLKKRFVAIFMFFLGFSHIAQRIYWRVNTYFPLQNHAS